MEEYNHRDQGLKTRLPASITCWVQIRLYNWFARKWERGGREPLPDLAELWSKMDLWEAWEPPPPRYRYELDMKGSTRSGERSG